MLCVNAIGAIVLSPACYAVSERKAVVFPDGYTVQRPVFAVNSTGSGSSSSSSTTARFTYKSPQDPTDMAELHFTAFISISQADVAAKSPTLTYTITRSDNPQDKRYTSTESANAVWRAALAEAAADFPDRAEEVWHVPVSRGTAIVRGIRLFGLHLKEVQEELMTLPDGLTALEASQELAAAQAAAAAQSKISSAASSQVEVVTGPEGSTASPRNNKNKNSNSSRSRSPSTKACASVKPSTAAAAAGRGVGQRSSQAVADADDDAVLMDVVAVAPKVTQPRRSRKSTAAANSPGNGEEMMGLGGNSADSASAPSPKRRRTTASSAPSSVTTTTAAPIPCPACGLSDTPFCAATGKPHTGAVVRENRVRGEVRLPGATGKPRTRRSKAASTTPGPEADSAEVMEVTVIRTQDTDADTSTEAKKATRSKRSRKASPAVEGGAAVVGEEASASAQASPTRRRRKIEDKGNTSTTIADPEPKVVVMPEFRYPPLRPPLSAREHHDAAQLLQQAWKAEFGEGTVLPPAVAAVPLSLVPIKKPGPATSGAAASGRGRRGRGAVAVVKKDAPRADQAADAQPSATSPSEDGGELLSGVSTALGSPVQTDAPTFLPQSSMMHPLEITQLSSSAAGKRLSKFLLQYTSERRQLELLRTKNSRGKAAAAAAAAAATAEDVDAGGEAAPPKTSGRRKKIEGQFGDGEESSSVAEPLSEVKSAPPAEGEALKTEETKDQDEEGVALMNT